jgi:hypothetical protein
MEESSIADVFHMRHAALARFRRALRREDQQALDALFLAARSHLIPARLLEHLGPIEALLLAMLIEEHKEVIKLRELLAVKRTGET